MHVTRRSLLSGGIAMKAKTLVLVLAAFACIGVSTSAATVFKISVQGHAEVLTATTPVERGSVILVRRLSDGRLTSIPAELARSVSSVPKAPSPTLADGATTVFLGPTGGRGDDQSVAGDATR